MEEPSYILNMDGMENYERYIRKMSNHIKTAFKSLGNVESGIKWSNKTKAVCG